MPVHGDLSTENVKEAEGWRVRSISIALRINSDSQKPSKKPAMVACVIPVLGQWRPDLPLRFVGQPVRTACVSPRSVRDPVSERNMDGT